MILVRNIKRYLGDRVVVVVFLFFLVVDVVSSAVCSRVVDSFWCTGILLRCDCKLFSGAQNVIGDLYLLAITYFSVLF